MKTMILQIIEEEIRATHNLSETADQFIEKVCRMFMDEIQHLKMYAPMGLDTDVIEEVQHEVLEIYRIKTYGFYSLQSYRLSLFPKQVSKNTTPTGIDA